MTESSIRHRAMSATPEDLDRFKLCFDANNSMTRDMRQLRWQYFQTPHQALLVEFAEAEVGPTTKVAGIYAVFPVRFKVGSHVVLGVQSLDTLTDAAFRGKGIFNTLAKKLYTRCEQSNIGLVYGFPNANSAPGFFKKLGWIPLDPVPFLIRPLRSRYFMRRVPAIGRFLSALPDLPLPTRGVDSPRDGYRIEPVTRFDSRADALWTSFSATIPVAVQRDAQYLNWRLIDKPLEEYTSLAIVSDSEMLACVCYTTKDKHGGRIGYVLELLCHPTQDWAGNLLLRTAVRSMARRGADAVLAWNLPFSPNTTAYRSAGFVSMPDALRPIKLHFGVRALDDSLAPTLRERANWYLSYTDSDTV